MDAEDVVLIEEVLGMTLEISVNQDGEVVYVDFPVWSCNFSVFGAKP